MNYNDNTKGTKNSGNLNAAAKFIKDAFTIDFDKPLTIKNQFMILFVTLFISTFLFTIVYFVHNAGVPSGNAEPVSNKPGTTQVEKPESKPESRTESKPQESSKSESSYNVTLKKLTTVKKDRDEVYNGDLILVNKNYACHHDGEETVSLLDVKTDTYVVSDASVRVNESIVDTVNNMFDDFYNIYGESRVMIACGYRSSSLQQELFDAETADKGEEQAEEWVAPPGYSEHQTGLVMDLDLMVEDGIDGIDYDGQGIYSWINENCYKYGFILRYLEGKEKITGYEYEPWHFRYVGVPAACYITQNSITLEEYMDKIQKSGVNNPLVIKDNGKVWYTYYVKANENGETDVPVPVNYEYTISGDNCDGFIVTAEIS